MQKDGSTDLAMEVTRVAVPDTDFGTPGQEEASAQDSVGREEKEEGRRQQRPSTIWTLTTSVRLLRYRLLFPPRR